VTLELSSFVVAAIIAAFLFADRLGGQEQLTRRLFQVALGFALAFAVTSATAAFVRGDTTPFSEIMSLPASQQTAALFDNDNGSISRDAASIKAGIGLGLLLLGFAAAGRWSTLPLGAALGGLLLLFAGGGQSGGFDLNSLSTSALFGALLGQAEEGSDIAHFVVMLVGTLLLLGFGYRKWEAPASPVFAPAEP